MPFYVTPDTLFLGSMCAPVSWLNAEEEAVWSQMGTLQERCTGMPPPPLWINTPEAAIVELTDDVLLDALERNYFSDVNVWQTTWKHLHTRHLPSSPVNTLTRLFASQPAILVHGGAKRGAEEANKGGKRARAPPPGSQGEEHGVEESKHGETEPVPRAEEHVIVIREPEPRDAHTTPALLYAISDLIERGDDALRSFQEETALADRVLPREGSWDFGNVPPSLLTQLPPDTQKQVFDLYQIVVYVQLSCQQLVKDRSANEQLTEQGTRAWQQYVDANVMHIKKAIEQWARNMVRASTGMQDSIQATAILIEHFKQFILTVGIPSPAQNKTVLTFWNVLMGNIQWQNEASMISFVSNVLLQYSLPRNIVSTYLVPTPQIPVAPAVPTRLAELLNDSRSWTPASPPSLFLRGRVFVCKSLHYVSLLSLNFYYTFSKLTVSSVVQTAALQFLRRDETPWSSVYALLPAMVRDNAWVQWLALPSDLVFQYGATEPGVLERAFEMTTTRYSNLVNTLGREWCVNTLTRYVSHYTDYNEFLIRPWVGMAIDMAYLLAFRVVATQIVPFVMTLTRTISRVVGRMGVMPFRAFRQRRYLAHVTTIVQQAPLKYLCNPDIGTCRQIRAAANVTDRDVYNTEQECEQRCRELALGRLETGNVRASFSSTPSLPPAPSAPAVAPAPPPQEEEEESSASLDALV